MSYQAGPQKTTVELWALKTLKLHKQHTLPKFLLIKNAYTYTTYIKENTDENTKKKVNLVKVCFIGNYMPSKPQSNDYATSGLENSEIIEATYFNLALAYKKMHRS